MFCLFSYLNKIKIRPKTFNIAASSLTYDSVILPHSDARNRTLAAGKDTLLTAQWQRSIQDRIANLMTPQDFTRLSVHTQQ
jgi:hypothetical protein